MMLGPRVVIIGNSGSGKTTLARLLESRIGGEHIDLDRIHWLDEVGIKRDETEAKTMVAALAREPHWIIEGVYGWLAEAAIPRATSLIWLDMTPEVCRESLTMRGLWRGATPDEHAELLAWADDYWLRRTPSSYEGHLSLYGKFQGNKVRIVSRSDIASLVGAP
jgi:adenylate kinase family enzyme